MPTVYEVAVSLMTLVDPKQTPLFVTNNNDAFWPYAHTMAFHLLHQPESVLEMEAAVFDWQRMWRDNPFHAAAMVGLQQQMRDQDIKSIQLEGCDQSILVSDLERVWDLPELEITREVAERLKAKVSSADNGVPAIVRGH